MHTDRDIDADPAPGSPVRPRRFRRRLLLVLALAGLLPLLAWGALLRSLVGNLLAVSPPVGELVGRAADALEAGGGAPATVAELRLAELRLAQADLARRQLLTRAPALFAAAAGASAALVALAALLLARRLSRQIEALGEAMDRYARGELEHQVPVSRRPDELDHLAVELNRMGRELARQRERVQMSEALAAWRDAARALAHDLKNPLTAMRMALGRLTRPGRTEAALGESVSLLQDELDVLIRMSGNFAEFARLPEPQRRPVDLAALVEDLAGLYRPEAPGGRLEVEVSGPATVLGDPDQLRRALGNLVKNALEASRPPAGPPSLRLLPGPGPGRVQIEVRDQGAGIPAPIAGQELMRGLRSEKAGGQRGLGLPIAYKIVHDHGGQLRLLPGEGRGTRALLELPLLPGEPHAARARRGVEPARAGAQGAPS